MLVSVVGALIFFLPVAGALQESSSGWPGFMMSGDIQKFYIPSYVEGYRRLWQGSLLGIDFLTADGASVFAYRSNLMPIYPPYLISYLFFDISNLKTAVWCYVAIHVLHMMAGIYFSIRLGRRFLGFDTATSILFAFLFCLSSQAASYIAFATFYFQMMLVPIVSYTICGLYLERSWRRAVLCSPVFVCMLLTSYGPMMAAAFMTAAALAAYVFITRIKPLFRVRPLLLLLKPSLSVLIAASSVLPYYVAQLNYKDQVAPSYQSVQTIAQDLAFSGLDLINAFSQSMRLNTTVTEGRLNWGIVPTLLIGLGLFAIALRRERLSGRQVRLWCFGAAGYCVYLLISLGRSLVPADMFYYGVPFLGAMHIFQRYLIFGQIFFAIAAAGAAKLFLSVATPKWRGLLLAGGLSAWFVISAWLNLRKDVLASSIDVAALSAEVLVALLATVCLVIARSGRGIVAVALLASIVSTQQMYSMQAVLGRPAIWKEEIDPGSAMHRRLMDFFEGGARKDLYKVLNVTEGPASFVYRNHPWLVGGEIKLMSYHGYETHLSMTREYWALMGGTFGDYNRDWVVRTGLDYIVWNDATAWRVDALRKDAADFIAIGDTLRLDSSLSIGRIRYLKPATLGTTSQILSLSVATAANWPPVTISDGWAIEKGALKKTSGLVGNFSVPVNISPGIVYRLTFSTDASKGVVTSALGGFGGEPVPVSAPGRYGVTLKPVARGDLWIGATNDFDGALTDIVLQEVLQAPVEPMPVAFDNGILRVEGDLEAVRIERFATNYSTRVALDVSVESKARLAYLLWPIAYMVPYLDGKQVAWTREGNWPSYLMLPPGQHTFELRFESIWGTALVVTMSLYTLSMISMSILILLPWRRRDCQESCARG